MKTRHLALCCIAATSRRLSGCAFSPAGRADSGAGGSGSAGVE
jgi:hypothetical protein